MADTKISALTELAEAPATDDVLPMVDTSASATKKIQISNLTGGKVNDTGDTMTGLLQFSGTDHAGIKMNSVTTTQRDALVSPLAGMVVWNTTTGQLEKYNGTAWAAVAAVSLTADVSGILPTANGGTGIAFFTAAGPTVARAYTFPDVATTILTANAAVTVAQGGTGVATLGDAGVLIGNGTGVVQVTTAGTSGQVLTSNGAGVDPTFQAVAGGTNEFTYVLTPSGATLPNTNFPALNKVTGATNITNTGASFVYHVLDFDATTREIAHWIIPIPPSATPATHKLTLLWTNASGLTTETVQWDIDWRSVSDDEVIDAITTPVTINDTVSDTWIAQGDVHSVTVTLSSATNVVAGDNLQMTISRDVATDSLTGDARFLKAVYEITS